MTKDIGIVFLPNKACKDFAFAMTKRAAKELTSFKELPNNPHITAIHIANVNEDTEAKIKTEFQDFHSKLPQNCIALPIKAISATGGDNFAGYKWLDLQFETLPLLATTRQDIVARFCPFHNGILERMNDDMAKFHSAQLADIEKCGVTFSSYLPHITAWYIDLPHESKTTTLQDVANSFNVEIDNIGCFAEYIALVELGRNGNAMTIIDQYPLCESSNAEL